MDVYLSIAAGGALGSLARFWVSGFVARYGGESFPWGTLLINVSGCFLIGLFAALTGPQGRLVVSPWIRQFVMVGVCGGYTTFSSFSLQWLTLVHEGERQRAGLYVGSSLLGCLAAVWMGYALASTLTRIRH
ncbi:MAG: fluoride efflux transporter CrcB [Candidatus Wallbacteria bacterium]|nr:fluoride efflux transporter CrcB [Candidatus Wallbacteria bacterium]